jgi:hypothetical protein
MKYPRRPRHHRTVIATGAAAVSLTAVVGFASPASALVTAHFNKGHGVLTVFGDPSGGTITIGRNQAGAIEVNGGAVDIHGARATIGDVDSIVVLGGPGNDRLAIDSANGPLPDAQLHGGDGDDVIFGGNGNDVLVGGPGNDVLAGGAGSDQSFGGGGDDQLIWNPGDGSDLNEGGDGADSVVVNGGGVGESFTATAVGSRVRFDRVTPLPFSLDIGTTERLVLDANGGDDSFSTSGDLAPLIALSVDGGAGNDRIDGGNGSDTLVGGPGDDVVDGNQGADSALLGDGNDTFVWDAGDGSDTVEGQAGQDALVFNGAGLAERLSLSAKGSRVALVRDVGHVSMDLNGIEQVVTNALGGADTVTVGDLSGTDVTEARVNLAGPLNQKAGDGADDSVVVNGTEAADDIAVTGTLADGASITGLHPLVEVSASDGTTDSLTVNALGGDDTIDAGGLAEGVIGLILDGGSGTNVLIP